MCAFLTTCCLFCCYWLQKIPGFGPVLSLLCKNILSKHYEVINFWRSLKHQRFHLSQNQFILTRSLSTDLLFHHAVVFQLYLEDRNVWWRLYNGLAVCNKRPKICHSCVVQMEKVFFPSFLWFMFSCCVCVSLCFFLWASCGGMFSVCWCFCGWFFFLFLCFFCCLCSFLCFIYYLWSSFMGVTCCHCFEPPIVMKCSLYQKKKNTCHVYFGFQALSWKS